MPQLQRSDDLYNQPTMDPIAESRMRRMLIRNQAYRRDMARSPRTGVLYFAEIIMEIKLVLDSMSGVTINAKRLVHEVVPEWIGNSTAHRILKEWADAGMTEVKSDPSDRRAVLIRPTAKMLARAAGRWNGIVDESPATRQALSRR